MIHLDFQPTVENPTRCLCGKFINWHTRRTARITAAEMVRAQGADRAFSSARGLAKLDFHSFWCEVTQWIHKDHIKEASS